MTEEEKIKVVGTLRDRAEEEASKGFYLNAYKTLELAFRIYFLQT